MEDTYGRDIIHRLCRALFVEKPRINCDILIIAILIPALISTCFMEKHH